MGMVSVISLLILSLLTYSLKWNADKVEIGMIVTYILAGFFGGKFHKNNFKVKTKETEDAIREKSGSLARKITDGCLVATLFVVILFILSMLYLGESLTIASRLSMVWLLIAGSVCVGKII